MTLRLNTYRDIAVTVNCFVLKKKTFRAPYKLTHFRNGNIVQKQTPIKVRLRMCVEIKTATHWMDEIHV